MSSGFYPRSALQIFKQMFGGYLVEGQLYRRATRKDGRFEILQKDGVSKEDFEAGKALMGEVRVTSPVGAAESAIKMSPVDPNIVIAGSNGPGGGQKMHWSSDGGSTWAQVDLPLGGTCCDPTIDWKDDGSLAHTSTLGDCGFGGLLHLDLPLG